MHGAICVIAAINDDRETIADVSTEEFVRVMVMSGTGLRLPRRPVEWTAKRQMSRAGTSGRHFG
ncbi:3-oxoacyl-ACP reductase [Pandoraea eparura]|jgi:hypothetical protein|uniref:3-oxoacyl-ACP reductase n=1 Tax=Pandoraea eparura TaxID=2508291 RepID=A0A5E4VVA1_9BURK|nr:hypothetical protein [Pandoraea eparura]VVE16362.1 3-oxoacyl-ACP reductase [Pandoraea eparura]